MNTPLHIPDSEPQAFALDVLRRLRTAGFAALWAGGCVRDAILGIEPKDYDVATSATPDEIVALFGRRNTVTVGAAFGVVIVPGKRRIQGQVEVATFRSDGDYSDGRRPDSVTFCSAREDAQRRDFTINAMFYDPIDKQVVDYVGGHDDLKRGVVRTVGDPLQRIREDKLRMLRAIRFSARFDFAIDKTTLDAIRSHAAELNQVSVERIAQELRLMLAHPSRAAAIELLNESRLFSQVFPDGSSQIALRILPHLAGPAFEPSLAALLFERLNTSVDRIQDRTSEVRADCRRLKLSNDETACTAWLTQVFASYERPSELPLHVIKPILADRRSDLFLDLFDAATAAGLRQTDEQTFLHSYQRSTPPDVLNPPPLISGEDLMNIGIARGPEFSRILNQIREEQLDEMLSTHEEAVERAAELQRRL